MSIDGIPQMSTDYTAPFIFQSPEGWDYRRFRILSTTRSENIIRICTEAIGTASDASWYRDQYDHDILQIDRPRSAPSLAVDFIITPIDASYGDVDLKGVHFDWHFRSDAARLGRIRWMQHWEVDGNCEGTTVYWQSQIASPVAKLTRELEWDNICWKSLNWEKQDSNISMQVKSQTRLFLADRLLVFGQALL